MNAAFAAAAAVVATGLYWMVAAAAAARRGVTIGRLPPLVLVPVAATTGAAALAGLPTPAVVASAGSAVAAIVDARTGSIFDPLTVAIMLSACALDAIDGSLREGACGAASVGGALLLVFAVSRGRGLGLGDVKLGTALGMALGLAGGLTAIALAFVFGAAYGTWLLMRKRARRGTAIRFGPFIAAGTYAVLLAAHGYRP